MKYVAMLIIEKIPFDSIITENIGQKMSTIMKKTSSNHMSPLKSI